MLCCQNSCLARLMSLTSNSKTLNYRLSLHYLKFSNLLQKEVKLFDLAFFCQEDYMTDTWTYFDEKEGMITNIYDKDCANEEMKKKLFVGI